MMFKKDVETTFGIKLSNKQMEKFKDYFEILVEYNSHTNLTSITDEKEVYYKHFFDSLSLMRNVDLSKVTTICDIGAGAGFPSIPNKILYPHLHVTIIDSLGKRITFMEQLILKLDLENVELINERAEIVAATRQNQYDLVTARAVAELRILSEMSLPMVKVHGHLLALKGVNYATELENAKSTIKKLGCEIVEIDEFELPYEYGRRTNIFITKKKHVAGFPRPYQQILKNSL